MDRCFKKAGASYSVGGMMFLRNRSRKQYAKKKKQKTTQAAKYKLGELAQSPTAERRAGRQELPVGQTVGRASC